jgi:FAD-linked oxidoreductase
MSLEGFQGIEDIPEPGLVSVRAGTTLKRLGQELFTEGLGQENLGDIDVQSLAGAISTGTHGTGRGLGNLSTQVEGLTLVSADGTVHELSLDTNPEMFQAARLSLGALGVIARVTLRVEPAYGLRYENRRMLLEDCLKDLEHMAGATRHFEFFWFPHSRRVHVKTLERTSGAIRHKTLATRFNETLLENATFKLLSETARLIPRLAPAISRFSIKAMRMTSGSGWSHEIFASPRLVRFHEMEYSVPSAEAPEVFNELKAWLDSTRFPVHFPVECRFVKGDDIWLSPAYGRDSAFIAVHAYNAMPYEEYFRAAEQIFLRHEGRPHWGKMHNLTAAELAPRYPRWADLLEVRSELDPAGLFLTPYLRALLGVH